MQRDEDELERLRMGVNCAALLENMSAGWTLDRRESTRRALKYRCRGEIVIINHDGKGWWDPLSDAKGDVFDLAQHLDRGLNFGQVRKLLRSFLGISPSYPASAPADRDQAHDSAPAGRWSAARYLRRGSRTWNYLARTRCLPAEVLIAAATADVLREGPYGTALFAHRNHDELMTGIEMRGPEFRGFTPGGRKTLFRFPGGAGPITRLAVCEAAIDALSLAGLERMRPDTTYVSMAGGMGPDTIVALELLLRDLAEQCYSIVAVATDSDEAGERFAVRLHQMVGGAGVRSERLHPPLGYNDWNQFLKANPEGRLP